MRHPNAFVWLAIFVGPLAQSALAQTLRAAQPVWTAQSDQLERANRDVEDMLRGGELFAVRSQLDSQIAGRVHERLNQYYRGLRVFGGQVVRWSRHVSVAKMGSGETVVSTPLLSRFTSSTG